MKFTGSKDLSNVLLALRVLRVPGMRVLGHSVLLLIPRVLSGLCSLVVPHCYCLGEWENSSQCPSECQFPEEFFWSLQRALG